MDSVDKIGYITRLRAAEDASFVKHLHDDFASGHQYIHLLDLRWKDAPLRHDIATEDVLGGGLVPPDEVVKLSAVFRSLAPASVVLAPLALGGHLDHRLVRQAAMNAWGEGGLVFYEDLPYACRMSDAERSEQTRSALPWVLAAPEHYQLKAETSIVWQCVMARKLPQRSERNWNSTARQWVGQSAYTGAPRPWAL